MLANRAIDEAIQKYGVDYVLEVVKTLSPKAQKIARTYVRLISTARRGPQQQTADKVGCSTSRVSEVAVSLRKAIEKRTSD